MMNGIFVPLFNHLELTLDYQYVMGLVVTNLCMTKGKDNICFEVIMVMFVIYYRVSACFFLLVIITIETE